MLLLLTIGFGSCEKFLQEDPTSSFTSAHKFTSKESGTALTYSAYIALPRWTGSATDWGNYLPCTIEYQTGKSLTYDSHGFFWKFQQNQVTGDLLNDFNNYWSNQYFGVRACNLAIELLPGITEMSETERSKALGEVRTLRAFYYFNLVRYFGDVVMTTESVSEMDKVQQPRTSLKTIYDEVIIPDLEFAVNESTLQDVKSTGSVTKHVARAILADVYLTCAGYPYQEVETNPTAKWCVNGLWSAQTYPVNSASAISFLKKAKEQLDVLYGKYTLGTYDDLHDPAMNFKGEAIFQASYKAGVINNDGIVQAIIPNSAQVSYYGAESGTFVPSIQYYNSYNSADKRKQERQFFFSWDTKAKIWDPTEATVVKFDRPHLYKYYDYKAIKATGQAEINWNFYRYADILLMLTEVNWTLRNLGESVLDNDIEKGINEVRTRALLPVFSAANVTLLNIMSERAYELIFENKMLWDMRRTRRALVDGNESFSALVSFFGHSPSIFSYSFDAKHLLSPIGNYEIQENAQCLQNFGYLPIQTGVQSK